ncbi:MAG TPA: hypothetical protein VD978_35985 [Azospirillum sp.]|nr:hypothetical protein [Azospirillum sp.]
MARAPSALLPLAALLVLGACASGYEMMAPEPVATLSPLELMGRQVLSSTGRNIGQVDDVVLGMNRQPEQVIVTIGAPMTMQRRRVPVRLDEGRFSAPQNAIVLNEDLTPEQVASRPDVGLGGNMVALGRMSKAGLGPTNWQRATAPQ